MGLIFKSNFTIGPFITQNKEYEVECDGVNYYITDDTGAPFLMDEETYIKIFINEKEEIK